MVYIVPPQVSVTFRKVTDNYEPCSIKLTKPLMFYPEAVFFSPTDGDKFTSGSFFRRCAEGGFYCFIVNYLFTANRRDELLAIVHKDFVLTN